jgi:PKD repeat protein
MVAEYAGGQTNLVRNTGTITKTGAGTSNISVPLDNDGVVETQEGMLRLLTPSPGAQEPSGDYKASGTGTLDVASTLTLAQGATLGALPGATVQLNADLVADGAVTVPNGRTLEWRSGIISGSGTTTVSSGGSLVVPSMSVTRRLQSTLVTSGAVTQANQLAVVYLDDGTWDHRGAWTINNTGSSSTMVAEYAGGQTNLVRNTGTITKTGAGTSNISVPLDNDGTVAVQAGTLQSNQNLDYDSGGQSLSGGTWMASGGASLRLSDVGALTSADSVLVVDGAGSTIRNSSNADVLPNITTITPNGGLTVRNGRSVTTSGPLTTAGTVTVGSTASLTSTGLYRQTGGATRLESATASLTATGVRVEVQGGTLSGIGTIAPQLRATGGTIAPGNSPGVLMVAGSVILEPTSKTEIEINGDSPGTDYDRLQATGSVAVDGTLVLKKGASYDPPLGQTFDVVQGASRTGSFSGVTPTSAGTAKGFDVSYPAGKVQVEVVSVPGPDLVISATSVGTAFNVDYPGTWRATVANVGGAASSGTITATLTVGAGQTVTSATGTGWSCSGSGPVTCTRSDAAASGASLSAIDVTVDVASTAQPTTTFGATVSGGGDTRPGNNTFSTAVPVRNLIPPVAQLQLSTTKGTAPVTVTADTTLSTGSIDSRLIDWGDGSTSTSLVSTHTYTQAGTYMVTLRVDNEVQSSVKTLKVTVAEFVPLVANAGDDRTAAPGLTLQFDGGASVPAAGIDTYAWNFGDGNTKPPSSSPVALHAYTDPGTYTVTLTVERGTETATDTLEVTVAPATGSGVHVDVTGNGDPLPGADVTIIDAFGVRYSGVTGLSGSTNLTGVPDGPYTAYAWADAYSPAVGQLSVAGGAGSTVIDLTSGSLGVARAESRRLTYDEIVAAGIDPADPDNQHIEEFDLDLCFGTDAQCPSPLKVTGFVNGAGSLASPSVSGGGGGISGSCTTTSCTVSGPGQRSTVAVRVENGQPTATILTIPGEARWLKEFFEVSMTVVNLAPPGFSFREGVATLDLPSGLTLAPTADPQSLEIELEDIGGGEARTGTWIVRGDKEGEYFLEASYSATLDPIGRSIKLDAVTAEPLKVWGASALEMTVTADDAAVTHEPYRYTLTLKNVTDGSSDPAPVYNPVLAIKREAGGVNYIPQPAERFEQGTDVIEPGGTFSADFVNIPNFSGVLNVAGSAVRWASGDEAPADSIESQPRLPATAVSTTALPGAVKLDWDPVPGATEYRVYRTPTPLTKFPIPPVPLGSVLAPGTSVTVPAPPSPQWYAVSSIDADGVAAMRHVLVQAAPIPPPPQNISVGDARVIEGNTGKPRTVSFTVTLSEPATEEMTVDYDLVPLTASAPEDFSDNKGRRKTLRIRPGSKGASKTSYYVNAKVNPDLEVEGDEVFQVVLSNSTGGYGLGQAVAQATIIDDDPSSGLVASIGDVSIWEGHSGPTAKATNKGKIWVTLSEPATTTVSVQVTVTPGSATEGADYRAVKPRTVTFKPGQRQKAVTIGVIPDVVAEGDETVTVTLSSPQGGLALGRTVGIVTILDDD